MGSSNSKTSEATSERANIRYSTTEHEISSRRNSTTVRSRTATYEATVQRNSVGSSFTSYIQNSICDEKFIFDKMYAVVDDSAISEGLRAVMNYIDQLGNVKKEEKEAKRKLLKVAMKTVINDSGFWLRDVELKIYDENSAPVARFRAGDQTNKVVICGDKYGHISVKFTNRSFTKRIGDSVGSGLSAMKSFFRGVTSSVAGLLGEKRQALTYDGQNARCLGCGVCFEYFDSDRNASQSTYFTKCKAHLGLTPVSCWRKN